MSATCRAGCHECEWSYEATAELPDQARNIAHLQGALHLQEFPDHHVLTEGGDTDVE